MTHQQRTGKTHSPHRNGQDERPLNGQIVRRQDSGQLSRGRDFADMRGAGGDDERGVDADRVSGDFGDERVGEDVLGDGDGDGAAEGVEEDGDRVCGTCQSAERWHAERSSEGRDRCGLRTSGRHVLRAEHDLHGDERDLYPRPGADARDDLVADPLGRAGIDLQRFEQAGADRENGCAEPHEGRVPAEGGDEAADDDGGDGDADEVGNGADAGSFGGGAFDGLEVEGEVEDVSDGVVSRSVSW